MEKSLNATALDWYTNMAADKFHYRKIPKLSPSKYKPPKLVTQKTLR